MNKSQAKVAKYLVVQEIKWKDDKGIEFVTKSNI